MIDFDLVVFDMDGVLADTGRCHGRAFDDLWQMLGRTGPPYDEIAGRKTSEVVAEVMRDFTPAPAEISEWVCFKQTRARHYLEVEEIAFPDTADCLATLVRRGHRLALGTGASRATTELVLNRLGAADVFEAIVTGEQASNGKPAPDIYRAVLKEAGVAPRQALIVEDSMSGLAAAIASQAYAATVRTGRTVKSERFVGTFPDLRALLDAMGVAPA